MQEARGNFSLEKRWVRKHERMMQISGDLWVFHQRWQMMSLMGTWECVLDKYVSKKNWRSTSERNPLAVTKESDYGKLRKTPKQKNNEKSI